MIVSLFKVLAAILLVIAGAYLFVAVWVIGYRQINNVIDVVASAPDRKLDSVELNYPKRLLSYPTESIDIRQTRLNLLNASYIVKMMISNQIHRYRSPYVLMCLSGERDSGCYHWSIWEKTFVNDKGEALNVNGKSSK